MELLNGRLTHTRRQVYTHLEHILISGYTKVECKSMLVISILFLLIRGGITLQLDVSLPIYNIVNYLSS